MDLPQPIVPPSRVMATPHKTTAPARRITKVTETPRFRPRPPRLQSKVPLTPACRPILPRSTQQSTLRTSVSRLPFHYFKEWNEVVAPNERKNLFGRRASPLPESQSTPIPQPQSKPVPAAMASASFPAGPVNPPNTAPQLRTIKSFPGNAATKTPSATTRSPPLEPKTGFAANLRRNLASITHGMPRTYLKINERMEEREAARKLEMARNARAHPVESVEKARNLLDNINAERQEEACKEHSRAKREEEAEKKETEVEEEGKEETQYQGPCRPILPLSTQQSTLRTSVSRLPFHYFKEWKGVVAPNERKNLFGRRASPLPESQSTPVSQPQSKPLPAPMACASLSTGPVNPPNTAPQPRTLKSFPGNAAPTTPSATGRFPPLEPKTDFVAKLGRNLVAMSHGERIYQKINKRMKEREASRGLEMARNARAIESVEKARKLLDNIKAERQEEACKEHSGDKREEEVEKKETEVEEEAKEETRYQDPYAGPAPSDYIEVSTEADESKFDSGSYQEGYLNEQPEESEFDSGSDQKGYLNEQPEEVQPFDWASALFAIPANKCGEESITTPEVEAAMVASQGTKRKGTPASGDDEVEEDAPQAKKARGGRPRKAAPRKAEPPAGRWNLRPRKAEPEKVEPPAGRRNLRPRFAATFTALSVPIAAPARVAKRKATLVGEVAQGQPVKRAKCPPRKAATKKAEPMEEAAENQEVEFPPQEKKSTGCPRKKTTANRTTKATSASITAESNEEGFADDEDEEKAAAKTAKARKGKAATTATRRSTRAK